MRRSYHTYILSNKRRTVLYIGVTNNLFKRLDDHRTGKGSKFVKKYNVLDLLYYETYPTPGDAIAREKQLKAWRREWKLALIRERNPGLLTIEPDPWVV